MVQPFLFACSEEEYESASQGEIYVHFLDVGQGDCTLLRTQDTAILVDTGDSESAKTVISYLDKLEIETLDCVILTHPHDDHIGGAAAIFSRFIVKACLLPNAVADTVTFRGLLDVLVGRGVEISEGCCNDLFRYGDISIDILWPTEYPLLTDDDACSLVFRASFQGNRILFPGDAPAAVEAALLAAVNTDMLRAQLLKVGHHGARTSTTEAFLSAVSPQHAIISCGRGNAYAYPHIDLLTRLLAKKVKIHRTDTDGTVVFRGDGVSFFALER